MRVLLLETSASGHRLVYLRHMLPALAELASPLIIAVPRHVTASKEWAAEIADLRDLFELDTSFPSMQGKPFYGSLHKIPALRALVQRTKPDYLMVPHADGLAQATGLARMVGLPSMPQSLPTEGIVMAGSFAYRKQGFKNKQKANLMRRALQVAPWTRLHHLDDLACDLLHENHSKAAQRWRVLPDTVEPPKVTDPTTARNELNLHPDKFYITCVGSITPRKGVDLLLKSFIEADFSDDIVLALIGPHDEPIKKLLAGSFAKHVESGRVLSHDARVPHQTLATWTVAGDLTAAVYPAHYGSSSVVILAAQAGRPVLGSTTGWIGRNIPRFKLGYTCEVDPPDALTTALQQAVTQTPDWQPTNRSQQFGYFHSSENSLAHWLSDLRSAVGAPPEQNIIHWNTLEALAD